MLLPRRYRLKYQRKYSEGEVVVFFATKLIIPLILGLVVFLAIDLYRLLT